MRNPAHPDHRSSQGSRRPRPAAPRHRVSHDQRARRSRCTSRPPTQRMVRHRAAAGRRRPTRSYDIDATIHGGGVSGQAGALRMAIARSLVEIDPELPSRAEEGRPAHPRRASEGEQEVRPQEGPQGAAVHQALIGPGPDLPGAVEDAALRHRRRPRRREHRAHPAFALALGRAAARVLRRDVRRRRSRHPRSGPMLEAALVAGLAAEGVDVRSLGVVPTPAVACAAAPTACTGGGDLGLAQPVRATTASSSSPPAAASSPTRSRSGSKPSSTGRGPPTRRPGVTVGTLRPSTTRRALRRARCVGVARRALRSTG